jgi:hypothetical protein
MPLETTSPDTGGETEEGAFATPPTIAKDQPLVDHVMSGTVNPQEPEVATSLHGDKEKPPPTAGDGFDSETNLNTETKMAEQDSDESSPSSSTNSTALAASPSKGNSVKDDKDLAFLTDFLSTVSPEVAQKALRDNWRTFLFKPNKKGEGPHDHHLSFVLRAAFTNASPSVIERLVRNADFFRPEVVRAAR